MTGSPGLRVPSRLPISASCFFLVRSKNNLSITWKYGEDMFIVFLPRFPIPVFTGLIPVKWWLSGGYRLLIHLFSLIGFRF